MEKLAFFVVTALTSTTMAKMPVPLLDNNAVASTTQWEKAAPLIQAGLECRHHINPTLPALRPLLPSSGGGIWEDIIPPQGFAIFGLPVQSISLNTNRGDTGYTALVAAPETMAAKAAKINGERKTKIGTLMARQGYRPSLTWISCHVN